MSFYCDFISMMCSTCKKLGLFLFRYIVYQLLLLVWRSGVLEYQLSCSQHIWFALVWPIMSVEGIICFLGFIDNATWYETYRISFLDEQHTTVLCFHNICFVVEPIYKRWEWWLHSVPCLCTRVKRQKQTQPNVLSIGDSWSVNAAAPDWSPGWLHVVAQGFIICSLAVWAQGRSLTRWPLVVCWSSACECIVFKSNQINCIG